MPLFLRALKSDREQEGLPLPFRRKLMVYLVVLFVLFLFQNFYTDHVVSFCVYSFEFMFLTSFSSMEHGTVRFPEMSILGKRLFHLLRCCKRRCPK